MANNVAPILPELPQNPGWEAMEDIIWAETTGPTEARVHFAIASIFRECFPRQHGFFVVWENHIEVGLRGNYRLDVAVLARRALREPDVNETLLILAEVKAVGPNSRFNAVIQLTGRQTHMERLRVRNTMNFTGILRVLSAVGFTGAEFTFNPHNHFNVQPAFNPAAWIYDLRTAQGYHRLTNWAREIYLELGQLGILVEGMQVANG